MHSSCKSHICASVGVRVYPRNLLRLAADRFFCVPSKPASHTRLVLRHPGKEIVLARFATNRRPQYWWQTRPNFPPQFAQRFSNLVMTSLRPGRALSRPLPVDGSRVQFKGSAPEVRRAVLFGPRAQRLAHKLQFLAISSQPHANAILWASLPSSV
jgi:hypothetical protein